VLTGRRYVLAFTREQEAYAETVGDICRAVWNTALEQRREYRRRGAHVTYVEQARQVAEAKKDPHCAWLAEAPSRRWGEVKLPKQRLSAAVAVLTVAGGVGALAANAANAANANNADLHLTSVPAGVDTRGVTVPNVLSPQLREYAVAQGSMKLENPTADVPYYGYDGHAPTLLPDPTLTQSPGHIVERPRPSRTRTPTCGSTGCTARTRATGTAPTSSTRATRRASPGTSPGSTSTRMPRTG
jgi:hypothetical protein